MKSVRSLYNSIGAIAATTGVALAGATQVSAADFQLPEPKGGSDFSSSNGSLTTSLPELVRSVMNIILLVAGVLAVFYLIWSGIQYITSAGNADRVKAARSGIINAIIGIIIILSAYFIIRFAVGVGNTIGNQGTKI